MSGSEELYETLIDLENARILSQKANQESNNLLKGLKILVDRFNEENILADVISVLRDIVGCEDIIIMSVNANHELITQSATSVFFYDIQLKPQEFLKRIIKGDISISFDIQLIPEWHLLSDKINNRIKSAIHIGLGFSEKDTILICCDSRSNFFNHAHADLIKRYSTLVTQALINISAREKIAVLNKNLFYTARQAGMFDVATSVLHSVGNALNSLSVSAEVVREKVQKISITKLVELADFLKKNTSDQSRYFNENPNSKNLLKYLTALAEEAKNEKLDLLTEIAAMNVHLHDIKNVISMHQEIPKPSNVMTKVVIPTLIDDILKHYKEKIAINKITVIHHHQNEIAILTDQFQLEKIIENLIQNAIDSLIACNNRDKKILISSKIENGTKITIKVVDTGMGILPEEINKIFNFGFSRKKEGYTFGLHYSALAAKELGGELSASSEGLGQGAVFTLTLVPMGPT